MKDLRHTGHQWQHVLTGEGDFPLLDVLDALRELGYHRFISFEWEKKWHPELEEPEVALPHFMEWFRKVEAHGRA